MANLTNPANAGVVYAGKMVSLITLSKTNITQAELNKCSTHIQTSGTIVGIGDDTAGGFNTGASDVVHVLVEGIVPAVGANYGGATGVTAAAVATFFE
tara:strand:- start:699 stop:992 length:294 start_codon:yes stop_codon:yes gene_type:complete